MAVEEKAPKQKKKISETKRKSPPKQDENQLKIQLVRSVIGRPRKQREIVKGLGLRRIDSVVIRKDCPEIRGMINKISHLVNVEVLEKK
jgi:large subunit ribosomal protein L30